MNLPEGFNGKLRQMLDEAESIKFNEPQRALELANIVYLSALKSSDDRLEAQSLYTIGVCHELMADYPKSMKFLTEAIKLSQQLGDKRIMGDALNCVGIINDNLSNYSNALKSYFKALKLYEELHENKKIAIVLSNIGLIYTNIKDYKNALKFYSQALDIAEEEEDSESLLVTNINIGLTHNLLGNFDESLKFLYDALELARNIKDKRRTSIALDHIAETNIQINNIPEAYRLFEESKKIKLELDDKRGLVKVYGTIGHLKLLEKSMEEAQVNLQRALDIASGLKMKKSVFELHKSLADAHEKMGHAEDALGHLKSAYDGELEYLREESEIKAKNISTQLEIEQVQKEAEIQRLKNVELARALEDVKKLNVSLKELNDEKNELMAIAVHDLKNPLQNILSTARVIKRSKDLSEAELTEFTANIISQTDRMFNLIKKLLDHNAIEQGELKIKRSIFDVNSLISELESNFKESADKKGINLIIDNIKEPQSIHTDKEILYEILQNLLSNAIKFSNSGDDILFTTRKDVEKIRFEIKDSGPGFNDEDKSKMFNKFARLSAKPTAGEHSTGLGLSIVKKLCEILDADLKLESSPGNGAKFSVFVNIHP